MTPRQLQVLRWIKRYSGSTRHDMTRALGAATGFVLDNLIDMGLVYVDPPNPAGILYPCKNRTENNGTPP